MEKAEAVEGVSDSVLHVYSGSFAAVRHIAVAPADAKGRAEVREECFAFMRKAIYQAKIIGRLR
jgi:hypothetical protein